MLLIQNRVIQRNDDYLEKFLPYDKYYIPYYLLHQWLPRYPCLVLYELNSSIHFLRYLFHTIKRQSLIQLKRRYRQPDFDAYPNQVWLEVQSYVPWKHTLEKLQGSKRKRRFSFLFDISSSLLFLHKFPNFQIQLLEQIFLAFLDQGLIHHIQSKHLP